MPQRKSNMELLRIFAMCLIVLFHCAYHSGFPDPNSVAAHGNMLVVRIFWFFGELGVNLFILTTGYFQVNGRFKWGKLALLWAQVLFYSLLTACFAWFVLSLTLPIENVILPVTFRNYWFATAYVVVYMLSPYANLLIKSMDKRTFQRFLLTLLVLYSAIPTVLGNLSGNTENFMYYNRMVWLFVMYFTGAYIRLYSLPLVESMREALLCAAGSFALMVISLFALYAVNTVSENLKEVAYFRPPNTVPMVILSVGTFCVFLQLDIPYTPWINRVASATFGIYLLHDGVLRQWMWMGLFRLAEKSDSPTLIPQMLAVCACIFAAGVAVDFVRQALESVTLKKLFNSESFQRLEARFDVNNMEKEP